MAPPAPPLAVFDLDGTLVDSREDLYLAVAHTLFELGLPPRDVERILVANPARVLEVPA